MRTHFGDFVVDGDARQLLRDGDEIHLSPKALDLLLLLIRQRPRAVSKPALHAHLWPGTFVSDTSLAMLVTEIRAALGETGRRPKCVRTVHRHGYAFQATAHDAPSTADVQNLQGPGGAVRMACWLVAGSREFPLQAGENIVGRDSQAQVRLNSPSVSRRHARIAIDLSGTYTLEDLGSKNGTRAGGARVKGVAPIPDGAQLRFGSVVVTFRASIAEPTLTDVDLD